MADVIHFSGPLTVVISGLLVGHKGRAFAMSEITRQHLDTFWELLDEILDDILFVLIGFEMLVLKLSAQGVLAGVAAIPVVPLARFVSVVVPTTIVRLWGPFTPHFIKILT